MSKHPSFYPMQLKNISFKLPQENILYDELLLQMADKQSVGESLRFWESPVVFIVLGLIGKEHDDIDLELAKKDGIPVLRRTSGGGTVLQGPGSLNYTLVLDKNRHPDLLDLRKSYSWISVKVIETLKVCGVEAVFKPISDIALVDHEKKFSGNAQHRGKNYILHHGTILYNFDLNLISRYLKMPKDKPEYRMNRSHKDFVTNINMQPQLFKGTLAGFFGLKLASNSQQLSSQEVSALQELVQKRHVEVDL